MKTTNPRRICWYTLWEGPPFIWVWQTRSWSITYMPIRCNKHLSTHILFGFFTPIFMCKSHVYICFFYFLLSTSTLFILLFALCMLLYHANFSASSSVCKNHKVAIIATPLSLSSARKQSCWSTWPSAGSTSARWPRKPWARRGSWSAERTHSTTRSLCCKTNSQRWVRNSGYKKTSFCMSIATKDDENYY